MKTFLPAACCAYNAIYIKWKFSTEQLFINFKLLTYEMWILHMQGWARVIMENSIYTKLYILGKLFKTLCENLNHLFFIPISVVELWFMQFEIHSTTIVLPQYRFHQCHSDNFNYSRNWALHNSWDEKDICLTKYWTVKLYTNK